MKKFLILILAAALALSSASCGQEAASSQEESSSIQFAQEDPDNLGDVLDLIYQDVDIKELSDADAEELEDLFHIDPELVGDYAVRYTSGRYGVADVALLRPVDEEAADLVLDALAAFRDERVAQFERYDVHDSLQIAKDAEIFTRGDYVIMLMLADANAARTVILEQIPG